MSSYAGSAWALKNDPRYYRGQIKECSIPGSSVEFSFKAADVYWRAIADSDGGKADVYIDDRLEETVDCYYKESLPFQFAFIKTGLDPTRLHTVRIVLRADKNARSLGTTIRHMAFEFAAESYGASAGFSNVMGKNNWWYQQGDGKKYANLDFLYTHKEDVRAGKEKALHPNCWGRKEICLVGDNYQIPGEMDAVRTFISPHAGTIRVEGRIEVGKDKNAAYAVSIVKNENDTLLAKIVNFADPIGHDFTVPVKKGEGIAFIVKRNEGKVGDKVTWDPTITFLH